MTAVGLCLRKMADVASRSRRSPSLLPRKTHVSFERRGSLSDATNASMALPTRPLPPVTMITALPPLGAAEAAASSDMVGRGGQGVCWYRVV